MVGLRVAVGSLWKEGQFESQIVLKRNFMRTKAAYGKSQAHGNRIGYPVSPEGVRE